MITTTLIGDLSWGHTSRQCPWTLIVFDIIMLIIIIMPLQVQHGSLLQYADDTCLICCGNTHHDVAQMLSKDLKSLPGWIANGKMLINIKNPKSSLMWFNVRSSRSVTLPPITVDGHSLVCVDTQKYLGLHIDSKLSWRSHVANACKNMAYYLYLIGYHQWYFT